MDVVRGELFVSRTSIADAPRSMID